MENVKGSVIGLIVVALLVSCSSMKKPVENKSDSYIFIRSVLDVDMCYLIISDSVYLDKKKIITDRSLGYDNMNWIKLRGINDVIKINVYFEGDLVHGEVNFEPLIRKVSLDTTLLLGSGKNLIIEAGVKEIKVGYLKK